MRVALIQVMPVPSRGFEARLALDWDGATIPGTDVPRVFFDAAPEPPPGSTDWITFLLETKGPSPYFETLGTELHDLLIAGDIAEELRRAQAEGPFRLLLKVGPDELSALPWELMRRDGMTLFTNAQLPTARVAPSFNRNFKRPRMCWPLRVLIVVGSADKEIQVEDEIEYIKEGFRKVCGLVDLQVSYLPNRESVRELAEAMQPDVFHFIGHGDYNDELGGYLKLEQEKGGAIAWTALAIRDDLATAVPRLAVLNACQSGQVGSHRGTQAAARGLTGLNVPAVIAMQGPIRGRVAARFAKGFYEALSAGKPLDQAVARARVEITDVAAPSQRDYALPSLILGAPPERILNLSHCDPQHGLAASQRKGVLSFVDRVPRRRQLWDLLRLDSQAGPRMFAITGPVNTGKGSFVRWCLGVASLLGYPTALAEIKDDDWVDSIDFLDLLVTALIAGFHETPAGLVGLRDDLTDYQDARRSAGRRGEPYDEDPSYLYEKLTSVLATLTAERAMVIGIDGVAGVIPGMWAAHTVPGLVEPIARGEVGQARLVVGLQEKELDAYLPPRSFDRNLIEDIPIGLFRADEFVDLASQRMRALGYAHESFDELVNYWNERIKKRMAWGVDVFGIFDDNARVDGWERET